MAVCAATSPSELRTPRAKHKKRHQLSVMSWPVREGGTWEVRYFYNLVEPIELCKLAAHSIHCVLNKAGLGVSHALPDPCNEGEQEDEVTCGYWVLYFLEEECGRWRGEGTWA